MIERKFVKQKLEEFQIEERISSVFTRAGHAGTKISRTPMGEKIVVYAARPSAIIGTKGSNIKKLTALLKKEFSLENPQLELGTIEDPNLDAHIIANYISSSLERFGSQRFKGLGHKAMKNVLASGGLGVEILITGKIPGSRAKRWRFYSGYLKKSGDISVIGVRKAYETAKLKTGVIGIQVRIMPPNLKLPDTITITDTLKEEIEEQNLDKKKEDTKEPKTREDNKESKEVTKDEKIEDKKGSKETEDTKSEKSTTENKKELKTKTDEDSEKSAGVSEKEAGNTDKKSEEKPEEKPAEKIDKTATTEEKEKI